MAEAKPPVVVELAWEDRLAFTARHGSHEWTLDGRNEAGPSPVVALASALGGCLAMDVVHILTKGRFDVAALAMRVTGMRADSEPRRFTAFDVGVNVTTNAPLEQVERAIALSREKYCSVWHSLRADMALTISVSATGLEA